MTIPAIRLGSRDSSKIAPKFIEQPVAIAISRLSKNFGAFDVLSDCSMSIRKGEVVVVCGPSGSGKSTLLKCVNGLEVFQGGSITVDGVSVGDRRTDLTRLRSRIGMVFQHFELYPHLSVLQNITLAPIKVLRLSKTDACDRAMALLGRVGLRDKADCHPGRLSGGQQQRVAIARALAMDPLAMLFDEPTSALDPEMINDVLDVMTELAREGMTMMVVTHEMGFARHVADRVVFMDGGRILEDAPTPAFFAQPSTERARLFLSKILRQ
jgi:glutamate/aspartate transport system ATP-binding protein